MKTYTLLLIVALFFPLAGAHAQGPECLTVKKLSSSHRTLHPGGDIELTAKLVTAHCSIPIDTVEPPALSLEPPEGFLARQPKINRGEIEEIPGHIWMAHEMTVHFTLHALYGAPTGDQAVPGTLTYTAVDEQGNTSSHSLALSIPVHVVTPPNPHDPHDLKSWLLQPYYIVTGLPGVEYVVGVPLLFIEYILGVAPVC